MAIKMFKAVSDAFGDEKSSQSVWLEPVSEQLQNSLTTLVDEGGRPAQAVKDFLHGTWFGHPLHPALIVLPLGAWTTAPFLDLVGADEGADAAIGLGILASLPTAAAGMADWSHTAGKARRVGLAHGLLNTAALGCYVGSYAARRAGSRGLGIGLSTLGLGLGALSAYLGGEIAYDLGQGVNRNAWSPEVGQVAPDLDEFKVAARADSLVEGGLSAGEITVDGTKVPLVLLKRGDQVFALNGTCSHMSGPLAEGKLVGESCVECPWHGSRFDFRDGSVVRGPAVYVQPRFEARVRDGNVEVRLARS